MQMPDGATLIGPTDVPELCWASSGTLPDGAALIGPTVMPE